MWNPTALWTKTRGTTGTENLNIFPPVNAPLAINSYVAVNCHVIISREDAQNIQRWNNICLHWPGTCVLYISSMTATVRCVLKQLTSTEKSWIMGWSFRAEEEKTVHVPSLKLDPINNIPWTYDGIFNVSSLSRDLFPILGHSQDQGLVYMVQLYNLCSPREASIVCM